MNPEKSVGLGDRRAAAKDDDGASNPDKSAGLGDVRAAAEDDDSASEDDAIGRRSLTSPTPSPRHQHLRLQVRHSLHTGLGGQRPLQAHNPVDTLGV